MSIRMHLGCGKRFIPGFVHVDAIHFPHVDFRHAIDALPFVADGSVDLIYSAHTLEHFHRQDVVRVLKEWHRVLRPGGVLRVAVPDFRAIAIAHVIDGVPLEQLIGLLYGRQDDWIYNTHFTIFDQTTLERVLLAAGFRDPRLYDRWSTDHADVDDYSAAYIPHMDRGGRLMSLNMEATA